MQHNKHSPLSYLAVAGGTLLFYMCALPIVDALSTWAQTKISSKVSKLQYTMAQDQQETEEIADRINGTTPVQAIGFQAPDEYEVEYEDKKN